MRLGSLFYLLFGLPALGGIALRGFPALALEISQAGSGSTQAGSNATNPDAADWRWRLTGTVVGPGLREAVFAQGSETRTVEEGREIDGWTLSAVEFGKAMLSHAGQTRTVDVDGLDEVASGRAALPTFAAVRAANDTVKKTLAKQSSEEKAAENFMHQATKAMVGQATRPGQNQE
jgi:hypothetical protein